MILKVGMQAVCEFGKGEVIAITKEFVIINVKDIGEVSVAFKDDWISISISSFEQGGGKPEIKLD